MYMDQSNDYQSPPQTSKEPEEYIEESIRPQGNELEEHKIVENAIKLHEEKSHTNKSNNHLNSSNTPQSLLGFIRSQTEVSSKHDDDTLIDIHLNNPLKKITEILEDIKRQKAFSFTLKGSLGIMGVALSLSVFGFFGTTHALCDKGIRTESGIIRVLHPDLTEDKHPGLYGKITSTLRYYSSLLSGDEIPKNKNEARYILVKEDKTILLLLPEDGVRLGQSKNIEMFVTGSFDVCTMEMRIEKPENLEPTS
jgi:hypothetical protein